MIRVEGEDGNIHLINPGKVVSAVWDAKEKKVTLEMLGQAEPLVFVGKQSKKALFDKLENLGK